MKKNIFIRLMLIIAAMAAVLNVILISRYNSQRAENFRIVFRTEQTLLQISELLSSLKDAETGQRGYLLTGRESYLEPFVKSLVKITKSENELSKAFAEDPVSLQIKFKKLQNLIKLKIIELDTTINIYRKEGLQPVLEIVSSDYGKLYMEKIRNMMYEIAIEESELLKQRNKTLENAYQINKNIRLGNLYFMAIMLITALIVSIKRDGQIKTLLTKLESANSNLENQVQERTQDLEAAIEELKTTNDDLGHSNEKLASINNELTEANQKVAAANEELAVNAEIINSQNNFLKEINDEKNKFIGMAAHDLKSPLNSINGIVELFKTDADTLSEEHKEYLAYMSSSTKRMLRLISDVLNVNRIETGRNQVKLEKLVVFPFVESIMYGLKVTAIKKNIKIIFESNAKELEITTDKFMLAQIIENLISNAIKFSHPEKKIFINLVKESIHEKELLVLKIQDQGQGIEKEELPNLFEKFSNVTTKPTAGEDSTGLGLSIVKSMVETLHGTIEVESEKGVGSTFILRFELKA